MTPTTHSPTVHAFGGAAFNPGPRADSAHGWRVEGGVRQGCWPGMHGIAWNPLFAPPGARPMLPALLRLALFPFAPPFLHPAPCLPPRCGTPSPAPAAEWTAATTGAHTARIDLGDGYRLAIDERSSEMTIVNDRTGESTRIWGDPHVDVDGKRAFDFWGTTTFTLENGTKITINTEPWKGNANAYVASQVVITRGANAIVVDGISQNRLGDLSLSMSQNGHAVDALTRDGYTLHENATGSGWRTEVGHIATQADLNITRPGAAFGPDSDLLSLGELGEALGAFLLFGLGAFGWMPARAESTGHHHGHHHHGHHHPALMR